MVVFSFSFSISYWALSQYNNENYGEAAVRDVGDNNFEIFYSSRL